MSANAAPAADDGNGTETKRTKNLLWVILPLAFSGLAELASLFFIQPLLPKLSAEYGVPVSQVSVILSAETAMLAIGMLFTGTLGDRFGRKRLIVASLICGGLLTMLNPIANSWIMLVAMRALIGFTLSGIAAAATAYISEEVAPLVAGVVTGYFVFGNSVGGMSGRIVASQLMENTSVDLIFYLFGATLLLSALFVAICLPASKNFKPTQNLNLTAVLKGGADHFCNKKVALSFVISFVIFGTFTSLYNFLAFNLHREPFNISYATAGLVSTCFILSFFTAPTAGRLSAKYGAMNVLAVLLSLMIAGIIVTAIANNVVVFVSGVVLFTACFFGCHSIGLSWVSKSARQGRGQATAFYLFFYYMGGSVVGYLNGQIFVHFDWIGLATFITFLLLCGIFVTRLLQRETVKELSFATT